MDQVVPLSDKIDLTYEQFHEKLELNIKPNSLVDVLADVTEALPVGLKALSNFDPTGISAACLQILSDNRKVREMELIMKALYALYCGFQENRNILVSIVKEKLPSLLLEYLERSVRSQSGKIEYLRNVILHGITNDESTLDTDQHYLQLIDELSELQLRILAHCYTKQKGITHQKLRHEIEHKVSINDLADELNVTVSVAQANSMYLIGKGLLEDWGIGRMDYRGPTDFIINDFSAELTRYAIEYPILGSTIQCNAD